jgi:hypothetical protein
MRRVDALRRGAIACACTSLLAGILSGCTVAPAPADAPPLPPSSDLSRRDLEAYWSLSTIVLDDGSRRWVVSPRNVLEFNNGFFVFEYAADEGIKGNILSAAQDAERVWIGTSTSVVSIDKDLHFVRPLFEEDGLQARFVAALGRDGGLALTARGVATFDAAALTYVLYPTSDFDIREVVDAEIFERDLWVGTLRGLWRFSTFWNAWNQSFGSKSLARSPVVRLERVPRAGDGAATEDLYAITANEAFVFRPAFDDWERLGF